MLISRGARFFSVFSLAFLSFVVAEGAAIAQSTQVECGNAAHRIRRLGNPVSRFTPPVEDRASLVRLFEAARIDVDLLLREAGWAGDTDDLYEAIKTGSVTRKSFEPGERFGWMFFRKNGQPVLNNNVCWSGAQSFDGWEIQFSSRGTWYSMVVPVVCGNLSFLAEQVEPVCRVTVNDAAGTTCRDTTLTIDATGSTASDLKLQVTTPSGQQRTLTSRDFSSPSKWQFQSDEHRGTFRFELTGSEPTVRGTTLTCSAETSVARDCCIGGNPSISVSAEPMEVEPFEEVTFTAAPKVEQGAELDQVTLDGQRVSSPYQIVKSWDEPGTHTISATVTDQCGGKATASQTVTVTECRTKDCKKRMRALRGPSGDTGWILRPFVGAINVADSEALQWFDNDRDRRTFQFDSGEAFGVQAEYKFRPWFGVAFGGLQGEIELGLKWDLGDLWEMGEDDVEVFSLFAGPMFHLTPNSRVDLFVGPLVALTDYDDAEFNLFGQPMEKDFDGELGIGAQLGLDIPFKVDGAWGLHLGTIYLDSTAEGDPAGFELDVDPWLFNIGLSYTFGR